jgi:hypothetical protein
MARPPRQLPPSAIDGYRRLARTRGASSGDGAPAAETTPPTASRPRRLRRPSGQRIAGSLRLLAFVAVLATIVGTSVTLASADPADERASRASAEPAPIPAADEPAAAESRADAPADESEPVISGTAVETTQEPTAVSAPEPTPAAADAPARALPVTGVLDVPRMLLLGSLLVLVGMLVQVAGQPLPARAGVHRRPR